MKTQYETKLDNPEFRKLFAIEGLAMEAAELLSSLMEEREISKASLARRMGRSRAWITQLLSGKTNMTVKTLAEIAYALDAELELRVAGRSASRQDQPAHKYIVHTASEAVPAWVSSEPSSQPYAA